MINVWSYSSRELMHSIETGHSANIFCTKFIPQTSDELVVSGAADSEVRLFNLSRVRRSGLGENGITPLANFQCHARRVKKLAVEVGNPNVVWSASEDGTLRQHDLREGVSCPPAGSSHQECRNILLDLRLGAKKSLADPPKQSLALKSCDISSTRPHLLLVGGSDAFARLYDRRMLPPLSSSQQKLPPPPCVNYFCPMHLSDLGRSSTHLTHVTFSPNGEEVLLSYSGEHVYLMDVNLGVFGVSDDVLQRYCEFQESLFERGKFAPFITTRGGILLVLSLLFKEDNGIKSFTNMYVHWASAQKFVPVLPDCWTSRSSVSYTHGDVSELFHLSPILDGGEVNSSRYAVSLNGYHVRKKSAARLDKCRKLIQIAEKSLKGETNHYYGIEACNEVLDGHGHEIGPTLVHECLCIRASLLLKRGWKSDSYMAIRDCQRARKINPFSPRALICMAEALSTVTIIRCLAVFNWFNNSRPVSDVEFSDNKWLEKHKEALEFAIASQSMAPSDFEIMHMVERIKMNIAAVLGEDSDCNEDRELDFETSIPSEGGHDNDSDLLPTNLNLRIYRRGDLTMEAERPSGSCGLPVLSCEKEEVPYQPEMTIDMKKRYVGHCNVGTDIKQASFIGQRGEYVASGSDDGRWFIWEKKTGRLVKMLHGDDAVVNCIQCHPYDAVIATSGIDSTIKIWTPNSPVPSFVAEETAGPEISTILEAMEENQHKLCSTHEAILPFEILERFRMHEFAEGSFHPFECTQS
ncbi:hypothetical protein OROGR_026188 [Orobanche gracilis]